MKLNKTISVLVIVSMLACLGVGCTQKTKTNVNSSSATASEGSNAESGTGSETGSGAVSGTSGATSGTTSGNVTSDGSNGGVPGKTNSGLTSTIVKVANRIPGIGQIKRTNDTDLHGRTINMGFWYGFQQNPSTDETSKRQIALNKYIEQTYNCKLNMVNTNNGSDPGIKSSILAGKPKVDYMLCQGAGCLYDYYSSNCIINLNTIKAIHPKDTLRYDPDTLADFDGGKYGLVPSKITWLKRCFNDTLTCDFTVTSQAGHPASEIYNWIKSGQWNWTTFEKVCKDVTNKIPGTYGLDDHGTTRYSVNMDYLFYETMLWSDNCDWIGKKGNKFIFTGGTPNAMKVLNQYAKWSNPNTGFIKFDAGKDIYGNFNAKKTAFITDIYLLSTNGSYSNFEAGVVPFPKGPDAKKYVSLSIQQSWVVIPKGVKDAQKVGAVLEASCTPLFTTAENRKQCLDTTMANNKLKDSVDWNMWIYDDPDTAPCSMSIYGSAAKVDISKDQTKPGWLNYVAKVSQGQMTSQQAVAAFTSRCNNILSSTF